jgi:hypothetical protein
VSQTHTLYSTSRGPILGDIDHGYFAVTAGSQYTITTSSLLNGADTYIRIFGPDNSNSTPIASNDNLSGLPYAAPFNCDANFGDCHENGNDLLASKIVLTSAMTTTPGNYFIEVTSSSSRPLSAGRYGTYTMKVTSP